MECIIKAVILEHLAVLAIAVLITRIRARGLKVYNTLHLVDFSKIPDYGQHKNKFIWTSNFYSDQILKRHCR